MRLGLGFEKAYQKSHKKNPRCFFFLFSLKRILSSSLEQSEKTKIVRFIFESVLKKTVLTHFALRACGYPVEGVRNLQRRGLVSTASRSRKQSEVNT